MSENAQLLFFCVFFMFAPFALIYGLRLYYSVMVSRDLDAPAPEFYGDGKPYGWDGKTVTDRYNQKIDRANEAFLANLSPERRAEAIEWQKQDAAFVSGWGEYAEKQAAKEGGEYWGVGYE